MMTPIELKFWRKKMGYTQERLADRAGYQESAVFVWEKGIRPVPALLQQWIFWESLPTETKVLLLSTIAHLFPEPEQ